MDSTTNLELEKCRRQLQSKLQQFGNLETAHKNLEVHVGEIKKELDETRSKLQSEHDKVFQQQKFIGELQKDLKQRAEQNGISDDNARRWERKFKESDVRATDLEKQLSQARTELQDKTISFNSVSGQLKQQRESYRLLESNVQTLRGAEKDLHTKIESMERQMAMRQEENKNLERKLRVELQKEIHQVETRFDEERRRLKKDLQEKESENERILSQMKARDAEVAFLREQLSKVKAEADSEVINHQKSVQILEKTKTDLIGVRDASQLDVKRLKTKLEQVEKEKETTEQDFLLLKSRSRIVEEELQQLKTAAQTAEKLKAEAHRLTEKTSAQAKDEAVAAEKARLQLLQEKSTLTSELQSEKATTKKLHEHITTLEATIAQMEANAAAQERDFSNRLSTQGHFAEFELSSVRNECAAAQQTTESTVRDKHQLEASLKQHLDEKTGDFEQLKGRFDRLEMDYQSCRLELKNATTEMEAVRAHLQETQRRLDETMQKSESEAQFLKDQFQMEVDKVKTSMNLDVDSVHNNLRQARAENVSLKTRLSTEEGKVVELTTEKECLNQRLQALTANVDQLKGELELLKSSADIAAQRQLTRDAATIEQLRLEIEIMQKQVESAKTEALNSKAEAEIIDAERISLEQQLNEARGELVEFEAMKLGFENQQNELARIRGERAAIEAEIHDATHETKRVQEDLSRNAIDLQMAQKEIESLTLKLEQAAEEKTSEGIKHRNDVEEWQQKCNELQTLMDKTLQEAERDRMILGSKENEIRQLEASLATLRQQVNQDAESKIADLTTKVSTLGNELRRAKDELGHSLNREKESLQKVEQAKQRLDDITTLLTAARQDYQRSVRTNECLRRAMTEVLSGKVASDDSEMNFLDDNTINLRDSILAKMKTLAEEREYYKTGMERRISIMPTEAASPKPRPSGLNLEEATSSSSCGTGHRVSQHKEKRENEMGSPAESLGSPSHPIKRRRVSVVSTNGNEAVGEETTAAASPKWEGLGAVNVEAASPIRLDVKSSGSTPSLRSPLLPLLLNSQEPNRISKSMEKLGAEGTTPVAPSQSMTESS